MDCPFGAKFILGHALPSIQGGYTHTRHNEIRDTFANEYAYFDVKLEPKLLSLEDESFNNRTTTTEDKG